MPKLLDYETRHPRKQYWVGILLELAVISAVVVGTLVLAARFAWRPV